MKATELVAGTIYAHDTDRYPVNSSAVELLSTERFVPRRGYATASLTVEVTTASGEVVTVGGYRTALPSDKPGSVVYLVRYVYGRAAGDVFGTSSRYLIGEYEEVHARQEQARAEARARLEQRTEESRAIAARRDALIARIAALGIDVDNSLRYGSSDRILLDHDAIEALLDRAEAAR